MPGNAKKEYLKVEKKSTKLNLQNPEPLMISQTKFPPS